MRLMYLDKTENEFFLPDKFTQIIRPIRLIDVVVLGRYTVFFIPTFSSLGGVPR